MWRSTRHGALVARTSDRWISRLTLRPIPRMTIPNAGPSRAFGLSGPARSTATAGAGAGLSRPRTIAAPAAIASASGNASEKGKGKSVLPVVPDGLEADTRAYERKMGKREKAAVSASAGVVCGPVAVYQHPDCADLCSSQRRLLRPSCGRRSRLRAQMCSRRCGATTRRLRWRTVWIPSGS
jgi:hypothetical protein